MWISFGNKSMPQTTFPFLIQRHFFHSLSGHKVVNRSAIHFYSASKYAVTALTEGHRNELREMKSHIRVTVSTISGADPCCIHVNSRCYSYYHSSSIGSTRLIPYQAINIVHNRWSDIFNDFQCRVQMLIM